MDRRFAPYPLNVLGPALSAPGHRGRKRGGVEHPASARIKALASAIQNAQRRSQPDR